MPVQVAGGGAGDGEGGVEVGCLESGDVKWKVKLEGGMSERWGVVCGGEGGGGLRCEKVTV